VCDKVELHLDPATASGAADAMEVGSVIKVTFRHPSGEVTVIEAQPGTSLMRAAVGNGITEVVAECGGTLACATCHVYVDADDLPRLQPPGEDENEMLDFTAAPRESGSRLSCQIPLNEELDGIVVRLPADQY
jgi:ferredoxin, 2Fe-2S